MSTPVTIVTSNTSKFAEMQEALTHHNIQVERQSVDIDELQENDQELIIRDKCMKAYQHVGGPVLVDDSGFFIEQYKDFPGVFSKFIYKSLSFEGLFKLIKVGDRAEFRTSIAYMDKQLEGAGTGPQIFTGHYTGTIVDGFDMTIDYEMPYAPLFQPDDAKMRMSEMTPEQRSNDHRHRALNLFAEWYRVQRS